VIWLALLFPLVLCAVVALTGGAQPKTPEDFLYSLRKVRWVRGPLARMLQTRPLLVASLTATNISVVSAFIYMIDGADKLGAWILAVPFCVILGYVFLGRLIGSNAVFTTPDGRKRSLLAAITEDGKASGQLAAKFITRAWLVLYILFAFFEIVMCAKLIAILAGKADSSFFLLTVTFLLFVAAMVYSQVGGMRSVAETDFIQLLFFTVAIGAILIGAWGNFSSSEHFWRIAGSSEINSTAVFQVISGCLLTIATQFYNVYNWHVCRVDSDNHSKKLRDGEYLPTGILTAALLTALVFIGLLNRRGSSEAWLTGEILKNIANNHGFVMLALVGGLACITISTVDSLMTALSAALHQGRAETKNDRSGDAAAIEILRIRIDLGQFYAVGMILSMFYILSVPAQKSLEFLLSLGAGAVVLCPFIFTWAKAIREGVAGSLPAWFSVATITLFILVATFAVAGTLSGTPLSESASVLGLLLSALNGVYALRIARKHTENQPRSS
jgi:hypothetical protein